MVVAQPTDQQRVILDDTSRVRVVHAAPGSGKTWLVAELIRREIANWNRPGQGIAAISFTRVGGEEIRAALGHDLNHPHFVGTIDAFLYRYVVRPFLWRDPELKKPRLLAATSAPSHWSKDGTVIGASEKERINVFACRFWGWDSQAKLPIIAYKPNKRAALQPLGGKALSSAWSGKQEIWKKSGRITHSDVAFLSWGILRGKLGKTIRQEITRRFPLIVVDELQDTGFFMGEVLKLLITEASTRGVVVGDPDQAIYEFNGATPALFEGFKDIPDAKVLPLSQSRRCAAAIIVVAKHLMQSRTGLLANLERQGRAYLVEFDTFEEDIAAIARRVATQGPVNAKVVVRGNREVDKIVGRRADDNIPKLRCPALTHLHEAVVAFCQGRNTNALGSASSAVCMHLFEEEDASPELLASKGLETEDWRNLIVKVLLAASKCDRDGNVYEYQKNLGETMGAVIRATPTILEEAERNRVSKPADMKDYRGYMADKFIPSASIEFPLPVQTVHGVKGETHDVTIFACKNPKQAERCPSRVWWSDDPKDLEERRIAYVAVTRTRGDLIVCVSKKTLEALRSKRSEFVNCFEVMDVARFTAHYTFAPIPVDTATPVATEIEANP